MSAPEHSSPFLRVVGNTAWLTLAELVGRLITLFAVLHLSRVLLPAGLGVMDLGIAIAGLAGQVSLGGIVLLAARRVARSGSETAELAGIVLLVSWINFTALIVLLALAWLTGWLAVPGTSLLFVAASAITPLGMRFAFWGGERLGALGLARIGSSTLFLVLCLTIVDTAADLVWMPLVWVLTEAARVLPLQALFWRRYGRPLLRVDAAMLGKWLRSAFPISLSHLARDTLFWLDILLLGILTTSFEVGIYSAALRIPQTCAVIGMGLLTASFPAFVRSASTSGNGKLRAIHRDLFQAVVGTALPVAAALSLVSDAVVVLLFGPAFEESGSLLRILIWKALLVGVGGIHRNVVVAHRPASEVRITTVGFAVTAVSIVALVHAFGVHGAAWGTLIGEATLLVGFALTARRRVAVLPRFGAIWTLRLTAGLLLIALVASLVPSDPALLRIPCVLAAGGFAIVLVNLAIVRRLLREM